MNRKGLCLIIKGLETLPHHFARDASACRRRVTAAEAHSGYYSLYTAETQSPLSAPANRFINPDHVLL